jgi:Integrase core domain/leucine-zipper of insertion element IS481
MEDRRCKLGLAGRLELVRLVEQGYSLRAAAAALGVAPATAHRWWHRWRAASEEERASRACLSTRPPRPRSCPWALPDEAERRILAARERTGYGPARLAGLVGFCRGTIWKVLKRHGVSRRRRAGRQSYRRFEWAEPGALLHLDAMQLPKFDAPGHWATGRGYQRSRGAGRVYVVSVVDDHSRLAYSELHSGETGETVSATLRRAAAWMREQGCGPLEAVMTDNHKAYTSHRFRRPARRARRPPHPHTGLHTTLERQARAIQPHPQRRMGEVADLAQQPPTRPRPAIVPALLQPPPTTHLTRRPATHQPRSARPTARHLVRQQSVGEEMGKIYP